MAYIGLAKIHKDSRSKTRTHGFKVKQMGTVSFGSGQCKGPNPLRNPGLAMPLHPPRDEASIDHVPLDVRKRYRHHMQRLTAGLKPEAIAKHRASLHKQAMAQAEVEHLQARARVGCTQR